MTPDEYDARITVAFPGSPEITFLASDLTLRERDEARKIVAGKGLDPNHPENVLIGQAIVGARLHGVKVNAERVFDTPAKQLRKQVSAVVFTDDGEEAPESDEDGTDPSP